MRRAHATVASLPMTRAHTMSTASGMTGLTLPGMIDEPGCRSGMCSSPRPVFGPEPIQRRSLQIFVRDTAMVRSAPDASTRPSRLACASKWSRASVIGSSVSSCEQLDDELREAGGVLMPVPTAVPPSGTSATRGSAERTRSMPRRTWRGVAAELLAEGDRRRVHEVGAAGLDDVRPRARPSPRARPARWSSAGMRSSMSAPVTAMCTEVGNTSFDDCEALTWSFGCTGAPRRCVRERREHLVHVHVRRGAGAGLVDVDRELVVVLAGDDLVGGGGDRVGDRLVERRRARALASAAAFLMRASAAICAGSRPSPEIGKFSTARCVCAL